VRVFAESSQQSMRSLTWSLKTYLAAAYSYTSSVLILLHIWRPHVAHV
jgi:hypothetical protein